MGAGGILDHPPSRVMTSEIQFSNSQINSDTVPHSRGVFRPSFALSFRPMKGAGNAGRSLRPQPCAQNKIKHTSVVTTGSPDSPGIPYAMVLTGYFVLSPVIGLV
jgi:hypothetical protein